ncbi:hypothetical protein CZ771_00300 [Actinomycetales bacterium JB111]|nr:hypothetical protein CZ771_00300 [Actinomycetales bacterium JB111]
MTGCGRHVATSGRKSGRDGTNLPPGPPRPPVSPPTPRRPAATLPPLCAQPRPSPAAGPTTMPSSCRSH